MANNQNNGNTGGNRNNNSGRNMGQDGASYDTDSQDLGSGEMNRDTDI